MKLKQFYFSVISYLVTEMENATFGIGRPQNCIRNGKLTMEFAFLRYGILMNRQNSPLPDGMEKSNTGIKKKNFFNLFF